MPLVRQLFTQVPSDGTTQSGPRLPSETSWRKLLVDETWTNTLADGSTQQASGVAGQIRLQVDVNTAVAYGEDDFNAMNCWRAI